MEFSWPLLPGESITFTAESFKWQLKEFSAQWASAPEAANPCSEAATACRNRASSYADLKRYRLSFRILALTGPFGEMVFFCCLFLFVSCPILQGLEVGIREIRNAR